MEPNYTIVYSSRKTLNITVERDRSVVVRAPEGADLQKIRQAVESKQLWIYEKIRHPQKYQGIPHPPGKKLVSGESMLYLGEITGLTSLRAIMRGSGSPTSSS